MFKLAELTLAAMVSVHRNGQRFEQLGSTSVMVLVPLVVVVVFFVISSLCVSLLLF